jgi:ABC-type multidrug transport system fused ATPase/permease subunit
MNYRKGALKLAKITFHLSKKFYILSIFRAVVLTLKTFIGVYGLSLIVRGLVDGDYNQALLYAIIVVSIEALLRLLEITLNTYVEIQRQELLRKVKVFLSQKLMQVEFRYLEDPKYLDTADKAKFAIDNFQALHNFLDNIISMIQNFVTMITLVSVILLFNSSIILVIIVSVVLFFMISKYSSKEQVQLYNKLGPNNRRFGYFNDAVTNVRFQKDYLMYPLRPMIFKKFNKFLDETCDYMVGFYKVISKYQTMYRILTATQITIIYGLIGYFSIINNYGVSNYIFLTAAAMQASTSINMFASRFVRIRENTQLLAPVVEIVEMRENSLLTQGNQQCEPLKSLRFQNVTFSYPGVDTQILKNVSFEIKDGEKVSIVGLNGAGKTTIVKLICKFYTPQEGAIYWNDIDINEYEYKSYINQVSAVFQDFKLFALTISQNVDLDGRDKEQIKECLYNVGLKDTIEALPNKEESFLSKQYSIEGVELSGGQQQKIAIARAMYKKASLTILDEPTSALDPLAEAEIYANFNDLVKGKTTIYISHRMSSSVFCDKIVVIDDGEIVNIDSHENLMKLKDSMYYNLYQAQSNYYQ